MSTVTYQEAMKELGVSRSTVERWVRITGTPTKREDGLVRFDLETLKDAWSGHREAVRAERAGREKATEASLSVSIPRSMRHDLEILATRHSTSLAAVVREMIGKGLAS